MFVFDDIKCYKLKYFLISYHDEKGKQYTEKIYAFNNVLSSFTTFTRRVPLRNPLTARDTFDEFINEFWAHFCDESPIVFKEEDDEFTHVSEEPEERDDPHWSDDDEFLEKKVLIADVPCRNCGHDDKYSCGSIKDGFECSFCELNFHPCGDCHYINCTYIDCQCGARTCTDSPCAQCHSNKHVVNHVCKISTFNFNDSAVDFHKHCDTIVVFGKHKCAMFDSFYND